MELTVVLASVLRNVRLRLTCPSSGFTAGVRKALRFWKVLLSQAVSSVWGHHKPLVILISTGALGLGVGVQQSLLGDAAGA